MSKTAGFKGLKRKSDPKNARQDMRGSDSCHGRICCDAPLPDRVSPSRRVTGTAPGIGNGR
jgi:hypothetical protein